MQKYPRTSLTRESASAQSESIVAWKSSLSPNWNLFQKWYLRCLSFSPFPPLKLVFLQETLSSFAISRSLHMSPSQTMMMMIHNDDRWVMMMILPVESLKQREGNRPAFHTRSLPGTTWIIMVNVMTMEVLLIMMIMIILMMIMIIVMMIMIIEMMITNHISCHSQSVGRPQGQCNPGSQLNRKFFNPNPSNGITFRVKRSICL